MLKLILLFPLMAMAVIKKDPAVRLPWHNFREEFYNMDDVSTVSTKIHPFFTSDVNVTVKPGYNMKARDLMAEMFRHELEFLQAANAWNRLKTYMPNIMHKFKVLNDFVRENRRNYTRSKNLKKEEEVHPRKPHRLRSRKKLNSTTTKPRTSTIANKRIETDYDDGEITIDDMIKELDEEERREAYKILNDYLDYAYDDYYDDGNFTYDDYDADYSDKDNADDYYDDESEKSDAYDDKDEYDESDDTDESNDEYDDTTSHEYYDEASPKNKYDDITHEYDAYSYRKRRDVLQGTQLPRPVSLYHSDRVIGSAKSKSVEAVLPRYENVTVDSIQDISRNGPNSTGKSEVVLDQPSDQLPKPVPDDQEDSSRKPGPTYGPLFKSHLMKKLLSLELNY